MWYIPLLLLILAARGIMHHSDYPIILLGLCQQTVPCVLIVASWLIVMTTVHLPFPCIARYDIVRFIDIFKPYHETRLPLFNLDFNCHVILGFLHVVLVCMKGIACLSSAKRSPFSRTPKVLPMSRTTEF